MKNKFKHAKLELQHIVTLGSALGMVGAFVWSLLDKKKTGSIILFVTSFFGFLAGLGMILEGIPTPKKKKLEISLEEDATEDELLGEDDFCDTTVIEIEE